MINVLLIIVRFCFVFICFVLFSLLCLVSFISFCGVLIYFGFWFWFTLPCFTLFLSFVVFRFALFCLVYVLFCCVFMSTTVFCYFLTLTLRLSPPFYMQSQSETVTASTAMMHHIVCWIRNFIIF